MLVVEDEFDDLPGVAATEDRELGLPGDLAPRMWPGFRHDREIRS
jgi:hypothetical protein